jgi:hypothetical protein
MLIWTIIWVALYYVSYNLYTYITIKQHNSDVSPENYVQTKSVRQSVRLSLGIRNKPFVRFSWNSVLESRTKSLSRKRAFREKQLSASSSLMTEVNEFLLALSTFLDGFMWTGTENLHKMPFCKYQINPNRSSGSHTVVQGVNERIKYLLGFSSFCLLSKYNPVKNMLVTVIWNTN